MPDTKLAKSVLWWYSKPSSSDGANDGNGGTGEIWRLKWLCKCNWCTLVTSLLWAQKRQQIMDRINARISKIELTAMVISIITFYSILSQLHKSMIQITPHKGIEGFFFSCLQHKKKWTGILISHFDSFDTEEGSIIVKIWFFFSQLNLFCWSNRWSI